MMYWFRRLSYLTIYTPFYVGIDVFLHPFPIKELTYLVIRFSESDVSRQWLVVGLSQYRLYQHFGYTYYISVKHPTSALNLHLLFQYSFFDKVRLIRLLQLLPQSRVLWYLSI